VDILESNKGKLIGLICVATAMIMGIMAFGAQDGDRVVYDRHGNVLILYGGDKTRTIVDIMPPTSGMTDAVKTISDSQNTYYGNSYVKTYFTSTVECDIWWSYPMWAEVAGSTTTAWYGTVPQYYSSEIRLDETWTFNGISVSVSYPSGVGFSGSSTTISWSGDDTSGTHWRMTHIFSGLRGESWVALTSVRQSSNGSHYFEDPNDWVSANATDGCSTA